MKNIFLKLFIIELVLVTFGCGGGGSTSSGGGDYYNPDYNLNGTWHVSTIILPQDIRLRSFNVNLIHEGDNVTGTTVSTEPLPPGTESCGNDTPTSFTGIVSGDAFIGEIRTPISITSFSAFGDSDSLISVSSTITISSGVCRGTYRGGMLNMTKI